MMLPISAGREKPNQACWKLTSPLNQRKLIWEEPVTTCEKPPKLIMAEGDYLHPRKSSSIYSATDVAAARSGSSIWI